MLCCLACKQSSSERINLELIRSESSTTEIIESAKVQVNAVNTLLSMDRYSC